MSPNRENGDASRGFVVLGDSRDSRGRGRGSGQCDLFRSNHNDNDRSDGVGGLPFQPSDQRDFFCHSGRNVEGQHLPGARHGLTDSSERRNQLKPASDGNWRRGHRKQGNPTNGCIGRQGRGQSGRSKHDAGAVGGRRLRAHDVPTAGRSVRTIDAPSAKTTALTNILLAELTPNFRFYLYTVDAFDHDGNKIESSSRCNHLLHIGIFDNLLKEMPIGDKESLQRMVFFSGSFFFSASRVPGLEHLPRQLLDGTDTDLETISVRRVQCFAAPSELRVTSESAKALENAVSFDDQCSDCTVGFVDHNGCIRHCRSSGHSPVTNDPKAVPASLQVFSQYANMIVHRAMGERMARWGKHFVDPQSFVTPRKKDGKDMGIHVFQGYHVDFNVGRPVPGCPAKLMLTVDLTVKVIRSKGILHVLCRGRDPTTFTFSDQEIRTAKERWIGQQVISKLDKTAYSIHDLVFEESADSLPVANLGMSHATYYRDRKNVPLVFPAARPMVAVLGRNTRIIYLPPEIVCANELDDELRPQIPQIASIKPDRRSDAIDTIKRYLIPGAQTTRGMRGLLPALGIVLSDTRLKVPAEVLPLPIILSCGLRINTIPGKSSWAPQIAKANFDINPNKATILNIIVIHHITIGWEETYRSIVSMVNKHKAVFRLPARPYKVICAQDDNERHWGSVATYFSSTECLPPNLFVLDFTKPRKIVDTAYPVVKKLFASGGILSQFVNFTNCDHQHTTDMKRSNIILSSVSRQILSKAGVVMWWTDVPRSLPLPTVFVGVDVYHAPRVYDPKCRRRIARNSVAAIVIRVIRDHSSRTRMECYSETFKREPGNEFDLGGPIEMTLCNAMKSLKLSHPKSCVVWRDGVPDTAIAKTAQQEIQGIRRAMGPNVPLAMIVCQKRIATKFFNDTATRSGGARGMPAGTLVRACLNLDFPTYYINGSAPPYATPKPVRFLVAHRDAALASTSLEHLTWSQMADYPNWSGTIKVPATCQLAHLLAEHAGNFDDSGESVDHAEFANHLYFL